MARSNAITHLMTDGEDLYQLANSLRVLKKKIDDSEVDDDIYKYTQEVRKILADLTFVRTDITKQIAGLKKVFDLWY